LRNSTSLASILKRLAQLFAWLQVSVTPVRSEYFPNPLVHTYIFRKGCLSNQNRYLKRILNKEQVIESSQNLFLGK
jgi:hypothetical protein